MNKISKSQKDRKDKKSRKTILKSLEQGSTVQAAIRAAHVSHNVFYNWLNADEKYFKQVEEAKLSRIQSVEDANLKKAEGYKFTEVHTEEIIVEGVGKHGSSVDLPAKRVKTIIKEIPPSDKAIEFYLINRTRKAKEYRKWLNANRIEVTGKDGEKLFPDDVMTEERINELIAEKLKQLEDIK